MKFGLFTCGYQRENLNQAFKDAASFGYDYVELWGGRPHAYAPDLLKGDAHEIRKLSEKYGIPVLIYTPEHNAYPFNYMMGSYAQWQDSIEYLKSAVKASALIGAEATLISIGHSGGLSPKDRHRRLLESLQLIAEEAEKRKQYLLLENLTPMESDGFNRLEDYACLFNELPESIRAMCDVVVPFVQKQDPAEYYRILGPRMRHIHLTDSNGMDESHIMPGDGIMDIGNVLHDFRTDGYDGNVTIELVTNYIDKPSESAELAITRIKELV